LSLEASRLTFSADIDTPVAVRLSEEITPRERAPWKGYIGEW
jgi:hypothetical protein